MEGSTPAYKAQKSLIELGLNMSFVAPPRGGVKLVLEASVRGVFWVVRGFFLGWSGGSRVVQDVAFDVGDRTVIPELDRFQFDVIEFFFDHIPPHQLIIYLPSFTKFTGLF